MPDLAPVPAAPAAEPPLPPDLSAIVTAGPALSPAVRAGIAAMGHASARERWPPNERTNPSAPSRLFEDAALRPKARKTADYLTDHDLEDIAERYALEWDEAVDGPLPTLDE